MSKNIFTSKFFKLILSFCFLFNHLFSSLALAMPVVQASSFSLPTLRYLSLNSANPHNYFNFLLDGGTNLRGSKSFPTSEVGSASNSRLAKETKKLINYFFLGISLPEDAFWVNLQPKDANRMSSQELLKTDAGNILLNQDLMLKKDVAKYLHPDNPVGKQYWEKLYTEVTKSPDTSHQQNQKIDNLKKLNIQTNQRVWIIPDSATLVETFDGVFISEAKLKVMLEAEYFEHLRGGGDSSEVGKVKDDQVSRISESLMKEIVIPQLTKDVNDSLKYAPLRQIYFSLILAEWFKNKNKSHQSLVTSHQLKEPNNAITQQRDNPYSSYINSRNTQGLESQAPWSKDKLFQEYLNSYQKGEYSIKRSLLGMARMYFSGGAQIGINLEKIARIFPVNSDVGMKVTPKPEKDNLKTVVEKTNGKFLENDTLVLGEKSKTQSSPVVKKEGAGGEMNRVSDDKLKVLIYKIDKESNYVSDVRVKVIKELGSIRDDRWIWYLGNIVLDRSDDREVRLAAQDVFKEKLSDSSFSSLYPGINRLGNYIDSLAEKSSDNLERRGIRVSLDLYFENRGKALFAFTKEKENKTSSPVTDAHEEWENKKDALKVKIMELRNGIEIMGSKDRPAPAQDLLNLSLLEDEYRRLLLSSSPVTDAQAEELESGINAIAKNVALLAMDNYFVKISKNKIEAFDVANPKALLSAGNKRLVEEMEVSVKKLVNDGYLSHYSQYDEEVYGKDILAVFTYGSAYAKSSLAYNTQKARDLFIEQAVKKEYALAITSKNKKEVLAWLDGKINDVTRRRTSWKEDSRIYKEFTTELEIAKKLKEETEGNTALYFSEDELKNRYEAEVAKAVKSSSSAVNSTEKELMKDIALLETRLFRLDTGLALGGSGVDVLWQMKTEVTKVLLKKKEELIALRKTKEQNSSSSLTDNFGGIDLNNVKITLQKYSAASPVEVTQSIAKIKALLCVDALLDKKWLSLSHLYFQEILLLAKDNIIPEIEERESIVLAARELKDKGYLIDPQGLRFLSLLEAGKPVAEIRPALSLP